jgi:hypothetical protein
MKKAPLLLVLFSVCLFFMGCPYNSSVPIDATGVKIDKRLIGKWQKRSSEDDTYTVTKKDENTYMIVDTPKKTEGSDNKDKTYTAFISDVDGVKFLNLNDASDQNNIVFYFYKLEFADATGGFTLFPVTEYVTEKFTASADLRKFFQQNKALSFFYATKEDYIKVSK